MSLFRGRPQTAVEIPADQVPQRFVVQQGGTMLAVGLLLLVGFGGVAAWTVASGGLAQNQDLLVAGAVSVLVGVVVLLKYKNHRLELDGPVMRYTDLFGRHSSFQVEDIASVRRDFSDNPKLLAENGRVLARCERGMKNFDLFIAYLKKYQVSADMI